MMMILSLWNRYLASLRTVKNNWKPLYLSKKYASLESRVLILPAFPLLNQFKTSFLAFHKSHFQHCNFLLCCTVSVIFSCNSISQSLCHAEIYLPVLRLQWVRVSLSNTTANNFWNPGICALCTPGKNEECQNLSSNDQISPLVYWNQSSLGFLYSSLNKTKRGLYRKKKFDMINWLCW